MTLAVAEAEPPQAAKRILASLCEAGFALGLRNIFCF
jgi:hypothetical protein